MAAADLSKFQVLILPSGGNYTGVLGESGIERVKDWVASGGTIVALGDAVSFLGNSKVELLELVQENALREGEEKKAADKEKASGRVPGTAIASETDFDKITRAATELPDSVPGAIARVRIRPDYWLTAGMGDSVYTMVEGRAIYAPVKADKGINAAYYDAADKLVVSGHLWAENKKQMAFKPLVVSGTSGRGVVVGLHARSELPRDRRRLEHSVPERDFPRTGARAIKLTSQARQSPEHRRTLFHPQKIGHCEIDQTIRRQHHNRGDDRMRHKRELDAPRRHRTDGCCAP